MAAAARAGAEDLLPPRLAAEEILLHCSWWRDGAARSEGSRVSRQCSQSSARLPPFRAATGRLVLPAGHSPRLARILHPGCRSQPSLRPPLSQASCADALPPTPVCLQDGSIIKVAKATESRMANQQHGLSRTLLNNMIVGVDTGFTTTLQVPGPCFLFFSLFLSAGLGMAVGRAGLRGAACAARG